MCIPQSLNWQMLPDDLLGLAIWRALNRQLTGYPSDPPSTWTYEYIWDNGAPKFCVYDAGSLVCPLPYRVVIEAAIAVLWERLSGGADTEPDTTSPQT